MKRLFSLLLVFFILMSASSQAAEPSAGTEDASGYDFVIRFHLNADYFPEEDKTRAQGYADLFEIIELKGTILFSPDQSCMEMNASLIPVTNPSSAISFTLSGIPTHLVMSSPLLGNEKIFFNNPAIPEFALKTYYQMKLPLPYLTLMIPYCARLAFAGAAKEWNRYITPSELPADISPQQFDLLADSLQHVLDEDNVLRAWLSAFTIADEYKMLFDNELASLPYYLVNRLVQGRETHVELSGNTETWTVGNDTFLYLVHGNPSESLKLSLPETDSGFFPSIHYSKTINEIEESGSLMLDLQYNRSELDHRIPFSLLSLLFQADYPCTWPVRNSTLFSGKILQKGVLLPEINLDLSLSAEPDGSFRFTAYQTDSEAQKETELLTVSGSVVPVKSSPIPKYTLDWAVQYLNIFSINDQNIGSFFSNVARSSFKGLLAFAAEVPASAFRSILDDLTDYRIISLLLGE